MDYSFPHYYPLHLQLATSTHQLSTRTRDGKLACLLDLGLEGNRVARLPHLSDEGLAGQNDAGEADLDVLEWTKLLQDVLARDTERAQAVQDGCVEAADLAELRVNVQWVQVAREAVDGGLLLRRLLLNDDVGGALWGLMGLGRRTTLATLLLAAEVAGAADEDGALVVENLLASVRVLGDGTIDDKTSSTLVNNLDKLGDSDKLGLGGNGEFADLKELLTVKQHARVEVGHNLVEREGRLGVEGGNHTESGDDLEVLVAFVDKGEIGTLGTNAEV
jgi:hypothetical protein